LATTLGISTQDFHSSSKLDKHGKNVDAEVIAITELLWEITDTNSVHIARTLRDIGVNLYFMTSVGDNGSRIADRSELLSPARKSSSLAADSAVDDMTRQAVARP
jgi:molybdopterin-biosynthesis enzyme MoeA-like protein